MRVNNGDLDSSVVEDGEAAVILKSDNQSVGTKNKVAASETTTNSQWMPTMGKGEGQVKAGGVAMVTKQRVPVEDSEEEDSAGGKEATEGDGDVEGLTSGLRGCCIQEGGSSLGIEDQLAVLSVKEHGNDEDKDEDEERRCPSLQSQSSIIAVDPPSLPHETEEEKEEAEDLASRGPTAGKPANFRPNSDAYNHISNKSYGSHNLDRFHAQVDAFSPQQQQLGVTGFLPNTFEQQQYYSSSSRAVPPPFHNTALAPGKRGMDEDEDNPYKYTRPVEEELFNNLSQGGTKPGLMTQFSVSDADNLMAKLGPTEDLQAAFQMATAAKPFQELSHSFQPDFDDYLLADKEGTVRNDLDAGYSSEMSPHSDRSGSPGGSPKSTYSPMSHDSGVASPFSPGVPSPQGEYSSHGQFGKGSAAEAHSSVFMSPASMASPHTNGMASPHNAAMSPHNSAAMSPYSMASPPSAYGVDELSMASAPSPVTLSDNICATATTAAAQQDFLAGRKDELHDALEVIADDYMRSYQPKKKATAAVSGSASTAGQSPSPHNNNIMAAATTALLDNNNNNNNNGCGGSIGVGSIPQTVSMAMVNGLRGNIPVSVMSTTSSSSCPSSSLSQQKGNNHAMKLPISPLPKPGSGARHHQGGGGALMKGAVPVMVMPSTSSPSSPSSSSNGAVPVTSSQPVFLMPQGQTAPVILVVNQQLPQQPLPSKKKQPVNILPRPGPPIAHTTTTSAPIPIIPAATATTTTTPPPSSATKVDQRIVPKAEPLPSPLGSNGGVVGSHGNNVIINGVGGGGGMVTKFNAPLPCSAAQASPSPAAMPSPAGGRRSVQNRNAQPSRMLNIARRLVASMTTKDLSFQDAEGDTYLHVSVCKADSNMVQALLERMLREDLSGLINTQNNMRQTPLYLAVSSNAPEMVVLLIKYNADVNVFAEHIKGDGMTKEVKAALHCAASSGDRYLATLQALLAARELNIDQVNSDGHTALHCAILEHGKASSDGGVINNIPIIQYLIKNGADPNAQGKKSGKTALMYALESRDLDLIENIVALIDPARLRTYLKSQAFDGSTCLRIMENVQRGLDHHSRLRLMTCLKVNGRKDN